MLSSLARGQPSRRATGTPPAWLLEVSRVVADLSTLNRSTEADFLAVGGKLMGFHSAARDIRADIGRLADCISGAAGEDAYQALTAVLDRAKTMQHRAEDAARALGGLHHTADKIQRGFSRFDDVVLSFRVVATLGRIETARLGGSQSDLGHFADEVGSCTEKIRECVEKALQAASGLGQRIDATIRQMSALDMKQLAALPSLVGAVETGLEAFRAWQQRAGETSISLAGEFKSFSDAMAEVVTAVQFHDITRQQIEHVVESLTALTGDRNACRRTTRPSADDLVVIELQRRQLVGAAETFAASVERVKRQLGQIAGRGREMAGTAQALLGLAEGRQGSFLEQMEGCFASILEAISHSAAIDAETASGAADLRRTIAGLRTCVADIRNIVLGIHRLALNATVEAVRLGVVGEPLSVVAGAMQTLRADVDGRSDEAESSLSALGDTVLSTMTPEAYTPDSDRRCDDAVADELRTWIDELHASSERSVTGSRQINAAAARLCADVQSAADRFTVGERFGETMARCCGVLQRITTESSVRGAGTTGDLHRLAARYTMQSERDVHAMATAKGRPETSSRESPGMVAPDPPGGFADNVELF